LLWGDKKSTKARRLYNHQEPARKGEQDIMNRRTVNVPDWNASMLETGDDMGVDDDGTRWVVEKVSEAYMTADGQSWVEITLIEELVPRTSAKVGE
jgi:hypothetical protein